jgi:hypothetical protein
MKPFTRKLSLLSLLFTTAALAACDRNPSGLDDHTLGRVEIIDRGLTERPVVATWTPAAGWTGTIPAISMASERQRVSLGVRIFNTAGEERPLQRDGEYTVRWALAPNAPSGVIVADDSRGDRFHGDHIHIYGQAPGTTRIQIILWHFDHADGESGPVEVRVVP